VSPTAETLLLSLPSTPDAPARARAALVRLEPFVSDSVKGDLRLLVTELVSNSVRHAGLSSSDRVTVEAAVRPGRVRVEVSDPGPGFESGRDVRSDEPRRIEEMQAGGFGLELLARLSDSWGVRATPTTRVWFELMDTGPSPGNASSAPPNGAPAGDAPSQRKPAA
jgi:anti-sigma regulatory factor (Ser/Thr protein kinase)